MLSTYSIISDKDAPNVYIVPTSWTFVKENVSSYIYIFIYIYIYIYIYII